MIGWTQSSGCTSAETHVSKEATELDMSVVFQRRYCLVKAPTLHGVERETPPALKKVCFCMCAALLLLSLGGESELMM